MTGLPSRPNLLPDRTAMGLPDRLVERLPADVFARHPDLWLLEPDQLVAVAEGGGPVARRYAAASLLGLRGDPRVDTYDPQMLDVPAMDVRIGLPPADVSRVVARWQHVGVLHQWIAKECPEHVVRVAAFRIARFPVTNSEYRTFLAATGSAALPTSWTFGSYPADRANHPVYTVPASAADEYARWLAAATGRGFRLPREAEWEYAASGGDGREFPWGPTFRAASVNTAEAGPLTTTPVGIYPAGRSPFGADDMAGNVEEFVAGVYAPYPGAERIRDDLHSRGAYRVARGGSFARFGDLTRCRRRHGHHPKPIYAMGFRLAETVSR